MQKEREGVSHVTNGSVLDDLGLDPQAALELKFKAMLHQKILALIRRNKYTARQLERVLDVPQPRVSELMCGKIGTLSIARLLLYAQKLGAEARVELRRSRAA